MRFLFYYKKAFVFSNTVTLSQTSLNFFAALRPWYSVHLSPSVQSEKRTHFNYYCWKKQFKAHNVNFTNTSTCLLAKVMLNTWRPLSNSSQFVLSLIVFDHSFVLQKLVYWCIVSLTYLIWEQRPFHLLEKRLRRNKNFDSDFHRFKSQKLKQKARNLRNNAKDGLNLKFLW
jgi:hypothetical protein